MSRSIETALVFPLSMTLVLVSASLAFPAYEAVNRQALAENRAARAAMDGKSVYRAFYGEEQLPQLESHVDALKDNLSIVEDNVLLFKRLLDIPSDTEIAAKGDPASGIGVSP